VRHGWPGHNTSYGDRGEPSALGEQVGASIGKFKVDDSGVVSANPSAPAVNSGAHGDGARFDRRLGAQRTCQAPGRAGPHTPGWAITDPRLCAAIVDRLTFGGNIIETGIDFIATRPKRAQQKTTPRRSPSQCDGEASCATLPVTRFERVKKSEGLLTARGSCDGDPTLRQRGHLQRYEAGREHHRVALQAWCFRCVDHRDEPAYRALSVANYVASVWMAWLATDEQRVRRTIDPRTGEPPWIMPEGLADPVLVEFPPEFADLAKPEPMS
jgi:hypothetical protein